jgi:transcriptional regulator with XRE-family HTH domain
MKERILEFLRVENKSSAQLAEEIGVQASGISHILSGRNNPSLDFVLKMLEKYKYISSEWLLFGKGSMYKDAKMQTLFDETTDTGVIHPVIDAENISVGNVSDNQQINVQKIHPESGSASVNKTLKVAKIVWFYNDNSFQEYFPSKD